MEREYIEMTMDEISTRMVPERRVETCERCHHQAFDGE